MTTNRKCKPRRESITLCCMIAFEDQAKFELCLLVSTSNENKVSNSQLALFFDKSFLDQAISVEGLPGSQIPP